MDELDHFVKHLLKEKYYIRYCDDFLILSLNPDHLIALTDRINDFLKAKLKLSLHPSKIEIRKLSQGIDFLGYVTLPHYRVLRTKTKRRVFRKLDDKLMHLSADDTSTESFEQIKQSYLGILKHCHSYKLKSRLLKKY